MDLLRYDNFLVYYTESYPQRITKRFVLMLGVELVSTILVRLRRTRWTKPPKVNCVATQHTIQSARAHSNHIHDPEPRLRYLSPATATVTATMGICKAQAEIKYRKPWKVVLAWHGGLDIDGEAGLSDIAPLDILDMEDEEWTDIQTNVIHKSQDGSI